MNKFFEVKAKFTKVDEVSGKEKRVTEKYLVDAVSVTEAEARATKELEQMVSGEFSINNANQSNITEVYHSNSGGVYYKCKVSFIDIDSVSGKEKKTSDYMLVEAESVKDAYEKLEEKLNTMITPYEIPSITKSPIVDTFQYATADEEVPEGMIPLKEAMEEEEALTEYQYGAMSSKYSCMAKNKLTAYAVMCLHYQTKSHLIAIYEPESSKDDNWMDPSGKISERLDEIFGGANEAFDVYLQKNSEEINECYKTIEKIS